MGIMAGLLHLAGFPQAGFERKNRIALVFAFG
jgi:hypothetical protein